MLIDIQNNYEEMLLPSSCDYFPIDVKYSLKQQKHIDINELNSLKESIENDINILKTRINPNSQNNLADTIEELGNNLSEVLSNMSTRILKYNTTYKQNIDKWVKYYQPHECNEIGEFVNKVVQGSNSMINVINDMNMINENLNIIKDINLDKYVKSKEISEDTILTNQKYIQILQESNL